MPTRGRTARELVEVQTRDGKKMKIPVDDYPAVMPIYQYGEARKLSGSADEQRREILIHSDSLDDHIACSEKYPEWNQQYSMVARNDRFARLLAKIAYGWTIAQEGSLWFRETITCLILGQEQDYSNFVGGDMDDYVYQFDSTSLPIFKMKPNSEHSAIVIVDVHLIRGSSRGSYHVVVGECDMNVSEDRKSVTFSNEQSATDHQRIHVEPPVLTTFLPD